MTVEEKQCIETDMKGMEWLEERLSKARFCYETCPVEPKNAFLGCVYRPIAYQKECSRLKKYNKRRNK